MFTYRDHDGKVTPEEVAAAAMYLKDTIGKDGVEELIGNLSRDRGLIPSNFDFAPTKHLHSNC